MALSRMGNALRVMAAAGLTALLCTTQAHGGTDWPQPAETPAHVAQGTINTIQATVGDPQNDTFGAGENQHDISNFSATVVGNNLVLRLDFFNTISPLEPPVGPSTLVGFIDLDIDQNAATGEGSSSDENCPVAPGLGIEYLVNLGDYDPVGETVGLYSGAEDFLADVSAVFTSTSITITIPLGLIGNDGHLNVSTVIGSLIQPTDCAPNGAALEVTISTEIPTLAPWALGLLGLALAGLGVGMVRRRCRGG